MDSSQQDQAHRREQEKWIKSGRSHRNDHTRPGSSRHLSGGTNGNGTESHEYHSRPRYPRARTGIDQGPRGGRGRKNMKPTKPQPLTIFSSDFERMKQVSGAARYKVHKPFCSCSKMNALRKRELKFVTDSSSNFITSQHQHEHGVPSSEAQPTASNSLNGLVVVPQIQRINHLYLCTDNATSEAQTEKFNKSEEHTKQLELKLKHELFGTKEDKSSTKFTCKVSCAECLLEVEPNGFVCVSSPSLPTVEWARDRARASIQMAATSPSQRPLHDDHANDVCVLPRRLLEALLRARTRNDTALATKALVELMQQQGIGIIRDKATATTESTSEHSWEIQLQHHLVSLLYITASDNDANVSHWMVLAYNDGPTNTVDNTTNQHKSKNNQQEKQVWSLDLPGGKRHLGESSLECAIRETEEESSLVVDSSWIYDSSGTKMENGNIMLNSEVDKNESCAVQPHRKSHAKGETGNVYYMMRPPTNLLMKEIESNFFWKTK